MIPDWKRDLAWTKPYMPRVKALLGFALVVEAPLEEDQKRNTDLMLRLPDARVAVRIRRPSPWTSPDDFTLRWRRDSGAKTEYAKIAEGHGDFLFYGILDRTSTDLDWWVILALQPLMARLASTRVRQLRTYPECDGCEHLVDRKRRLVDLPDAASRCFSNRDGSCGLIIPLAVAVEADAVVYTRDTVPRLAQRALFGFQP